MKQNEYILEHILCVNKSLKLKTVVNANISNPLS